MKLFNMKQKPKPEQAMAHSNIEQGVAPIPEPVEPDKIDKVLANQQIIVANQQVILDSITATQQLMLKLSGASDIEPEVEQDVVVKKTKLGNRPIKSKG